MATSIKKGKFPDWLKQGWASGSGFTYTKDLIDGQALHTVCQSARCPNIGECWSRRTATIMILGNACTRNCRYCSVPSGKPEAVEPDEPARVADAVSHMALRHTVITSVTRDDLPDGGAEHFAQVIEAIRAKSPTTTVEVLTPDFLGDKSAIQTVLEARPHVFSHNIETVARLYTSLRGPRYEYDMALGVLETTASLAPASVIKSAFMAGHGETPGEVRRTLEDLYQAGCQTVAIGQYLRPSKKQRAVAEFVTPGQFKAYEDMAYDIGFAFAVAGPFVRSSYRADEMYAAVVERSQARGVEGNML